MDRYRGWKITYDEGRPITGRYEAESFGVGLSAGSLDALKRMVDTRIRDYPPNGHGGPIFTKTYD